MSISERERQTLDSIESDLALSAPQLRSMLMMFTRLTADDQRPARKPVGRLAGHPGAAGGQARQRRFWRGHDWREERGWLWLVALVVALALIVTLTHRTPVNVCAHAFTAACQRPPAGFPAGA